VFKVVIGVEGGKHFFNAVELTGDLADFLKLSVHEGDFISCGENVNDF